MPLCTVHEWQKSTVNDPLMDVGMWSMLVWWSLYTHPHIYICIMKRTLLLLCNAASLCVWCLRLHTPFMLTSIQHERITWMRRKTGRVEDRSGLWSFSMAWLEAKPGCSTPKSNNFKSSTHLSSHDMKLAINWRCQYDIADIWFSFSFFKHVLIWGLFYSKK